MHASFVSFPLLLSVVHVQYVLDVLFYCVIIYKEMFPGCDWLIRVQLIPNITQNSAKICNTVQKSVTTVQKSVTTVQKSVTTVQKSVISSLSDGIYSQAAEFSRLLKDFVEISTQFGILL